MTKPMGKRILALDPGTKRMGIALSDELGWTAQPLETYARRSLADDLAHVQDLVQRHEVRQVVVGMPLHMSGQSSPQARLAEEFMHQLGQVLAVPIIPWDERLTSKSAEALLIEANVSRKKRKGIVDRVAAAILLQSYLESLSAPASASSDGGL